MRYKFNGRLIGILGKARAGKDTIAGFIEELKPHTSRLWFGKKIKTTCQEVFDFTDEQVWGTLKDATDARYPRPCLKCGGSKRVPDGPAFAPPGTPESNGTSACPACGGHGITYLAPREAFQTLGTEWGRARYPEVWIEYCFREAAQLLDGDRIVPKGQTTSWGTSGCESSVIERTDLVVVADVRFIDEAKAIASSGGQVWQVLRPSQAALIGDRGTHRSESEQDDPKIRDYVSQIIINDGTLDDLKDRVRLALR
jgi:hypothetical protein